VGILRHFLEQHQNKLNDQLLQTLPEVTARLLRSKSNPENLIASTLGKFGNLILEFPLGKGYFAHPYHFPGDFK